MRKFTQAFLTTVAVLILHGVLIVTNSYERFSQIDVLMHLLGGFAMGLFGLALFDFIRRKYQMKPVPFWFAALFIVGFAMLIGVAWEFYEFIMDQTINAKNSLPLSQPSLANTMKDLLDDWIGALVSLAFLRKR